MTFTIIGSGVRKVMAFKGTKESKLSELRSFLADKQEFKNAKIAFLSFRKGGEPEKFAVVDAADEGDLSVAQVAECEGEQVTIYIQNASSSEKAASLAFLDKPGAVSFQGVISGEVSMLPVVKDIPVTEAETVGEIMSNPTARLVVASNAHVCYGLKGMATELDWGLLPAVQPKAAAPISCGQPSPMLGYAYHASRSETETKLRSRVYWAGELDVGYTSVFQAKGGLSQDKATQEHKKTVTVYTVTCAHIRKAKFTLPEVSLLEPTPGLAAEFKRLRDATDVTTRRRILIDIVDKFGAYVPRELYTGGMLMASSSEKYDASLHEDQTETTAKLALSLSAFSVKGSGSGIYNQSEQKSQGRADKTVGYTITSTTGANTLDGLVAMLAKHKHWSTFMVSRLEPIYAFADEATRKVVAETVRSLSNRRQHNLPFAIDWEIFGQPLLGGAHQVDYVVASSHSTDCAVGMTETASGELRLLMRTGSGYMQFLKLAGTRSSAEKPVGTEKPTLVFDYQVATAKTSHAPAALWHEDKTCVAWRSPAINLVHYGYDESGGKLSNKLSGWALSSHGPSMAKMEKYLFIAWKGVSPDQCLYCVKLTIDSSSKEQTAPLKIVDLVKLENRASACAPALAALGKDLWMAWRGMDEDTVLYVSSQPDGHDRWLDQTPLSDFRSKDAPALAEYKGRLYLAWREYSSGRLKLAHLKDGKWSEINLPEIHLAKPAFSPSLCGTKDGLALVWGSPSLNLAMIVRT